MRLSTLIRECSAIIFALTEYEFLLTGSNHPVILFTDHKSIIYLFKQKNKPNHRVYRFQLILMKFPNLHIIWTEGIYTLYDDDYLRLINTVKQEQNYDNAKITDVFYDEKTKITEDLIRETQIIDPVLHKVKIWKKHNNKPHSVTMDIRGNKGLFAYYRKFKSIVIDEKTGIIKIIIRIHKSTIQRICLPLTLLLCVFYENHCTDTVGHTGLEKTKRNIMEKYYFPNLTTWIKILIADCIQCQTNKVFANTKTKSEKEQLAPTKSYFNEMIMIDTKGPIHPSSEGNNFIFVIVDAFSHYVTIMCAPKSNAHYAFTALFEHWFMKFGLPEEIRSDNGSEYINTELTYLCNYFEIKFKPSTTYAPWTNGLVEGTNRII